MLSRVAAALALFAGVLGAQERDIVVRQAGHGKPGQILRATIASPHRTILSDSIVHLRRDSSYGHSLLIVGGDATVASRVTGDVIVVDGDLFLRPGAAITGRAIAIGGGVYRSSLSTVEGGYESFRDVTFDVTETPGGLELTYRVLSPVVIPTFSLPAVFGFRVPSYTRVDGATIPWGPRILLDSGGIGIDPMIVYHSDLGALDPLLVAFARLGRSARVDLRAGRGTFTNERWIQGDLINSLSTFVAGRDYRNYYRADRAELRLLREWVRATHSVTGSVGALTERAWSVNAGTPFSVLGRQSDRGILRFNPPVRHGRISSAVLAIGAESEQRLMRLTGNVAVEVPFEAPDDASFTQVTLDAGVRFPTFRTQSFEFESHAVVTAGDTAPPQRFSYVGGSGTLPTFELLEFGGDQLLFIESRYNIPINRITLPMSAHPVLTLRHMLGAAAPGELPDLEQNVGVRLRLSLIKVDYTIEPVSGDSKFAVGLSLIR